MKPFLRNSFLVLLSLMITEQGFSQAPSITYSPSTNNLTVGAPFTISPTNSGGTVPATTYAQVTVFAGNAFGTPGYNNATGTSASFNAPYAIAGDGSGNLYVADANNNSIRKVTPAAVVTTFAGSTSGTAGFVNATGTAARFDDPDGVAVDTSGNVFVSDYGNNVIRKITSAGVVTTFYAPGGTFGPAGLSFDSSGNLLVTAQDGNKLLSITPAGVATTIAGNTYGYVNGTGTAALFANPADIKPGASGNRYVADYLNNAIREITSADVATTFAGSAISGNTPGFADGVGTAARFNNPTGLAVAGGGVIYVTDFENNDIRRIMPDSTVTLIAGSATQAHSYEDGIGTAARFYNPAEIYIDGLGNGYIAEGSNNRVRKIVLTGYTLSGTLPAGLSFDPATGIISGTPTTVTAATTLTVTAYNSSGYSTTTITISANVLAAPSITYSPSTNNLTVGAPFTISPANSGGTVPATTYAQVTVFAGNAFGTPGYNNATGTSASFNAPYAIAGDGSGNLYVADANNNSIRKVTSAAVVTTFAGSTSGTAGFVNATGTAARFNDPDGVAVDTSGNVFVSDYGNNVIRKITSAGVVTTFYAPGGTFGPAGLSFDSSGNLLVTAQDGNKLLSITPAGVATTIAGNTYGYVNGTGTAALFANPADIKPGASGNRYVADYLNNAIREITSADVVTTFAGSATSGNTPGFADGVGTAARFNNPTGLAVAGGGVIYVTDFENNDIRRIMPDSTVTLIAGSATQAHSYEDGIGTAARFYNPAEIYIDGLGNGYIAEGSNNRVRKIVLTGYTLSGTLPAGLSFDPATGIISGTPTTVTAATTLTVTAYNSSGFSATSVNIGVTGSEPKQYNWTGAVSSVWANAGNWGSGLVPGATDTVRIGLSPFTNQPTVGANAQAGLVILGGEKPITLTVNTNDTLQVNGPIIQYHGAGLVAPASTLTGSGAISCTSMAVGNNLLSKIVKNKTTVFTSKVASLSVRDSLTVSSCTIDLLSGGLAHNNATFSLEAGLLSVGGKVRLDNFIPPYIDSLPVSKPLTKFVITINSNQNATLSLADSNAFRLVHNTLDSVDFYKPVSGTGKSTVIFSGGDQLVYTNNKAGLDTTPYTYQNLSITGSGTKTAGKDTANNQLAIGGNLDITGGTLNLQTFSPQTVVRGNFSNTGGITFGPKTTTFTGSSFFNAGDFTVSTGVIKFSGGAQTLIDSTLNGTNFRKLSINHTGIKNIQSGKFAIVSDGKIRMSDAATLNVTTGAKLTLRADSTGSAAIAALLAGCSVTGTVNVEQYIQGSIYLNNSSARGFKQLSSAVYTAIDSSSSAHVFDIQYMTNSLTDIILLSGFNGTTNGFNVNTPTNNPTIYLFREDDPPPPSNSTPFLTQYNWKGIAQINNTPVYSLGIQKFGTRTNVADTATTIPVGNGMLVSFRGNAVLNNGTTTGDKITPPFNYPEDVTMTQVGTINSDVIRLRLWFANAANALGYHMSYTPANLLNSTANFKAGAIFVGNPYPAPINWDNLSTTDTASTIYGPNLMPVIYEINPANGQFDTYSANASHDRTQVYHGTGVATNIIPSTIGFFAFVDTLSATPHNASLTFREQAKFDPDAGSSPGEFSLLLKQQLLKTATLSKDVAKKSAKETSTDVPRDPDRIMEKSSGSVIPARRKNRIGKVVQPEDERLLRLKLIPLKDTVKTDDILIRLKDGAALSYSAAEDAADMGGTSEAMTMLSSYSSDGVKLAINSSPLPKTREAIKLYTDATLPGDYMLNAFLLQKIPADYSIVLNDKLKGKQTDLRKSARYTFTIDKNNKLSYGDRFELIIEKQHHLNK